MMICSLIIWLTLGFIMVKEVLYQIHFWILSIWLYAISSIAISSGRKKVETIMKEKLENGENENEDTELPEEEVTTYWKLALIAYSMALPLVCTSPIQYHWTDMKRDVNCNLAQLANPEQTDMYKTCMDQYDSDPASWNALARWRHDAYLMSMYAPCFFLLVEISVNQLNLHWKHITLQWLFTAVYIFVTAVLQLAGSAFIYVAGFDWNCIKDDSIECTWGEFGNFFGVFLALQTGFYVIGVMVHLIKSKYCGCAPYRGRLNEGLLKTN